MARRMRENARTPQRMQDVRYSYRWTKRYRPTDVNKRHRLEDEQPKTQRVTSYTRRS